MSGYNLSHLKQLEAESIHIIREVAAEFDKPVMLYSIGKDSSVMLHLAHKAFAPGRIPFPLMHVDTQWKFREMYRFRELMARTGFPTDDYVTLELPTPSTDVLSDPHHGGGSGERGVVGVRRGKARLRGAAVLAAVRQQQATEVLRHQIGAAGPRWF